MPDPRGLFAMIACCTVWGVSGIYFHALREIGALEVLAHRMIWSTLLLGALVLLSPRTRRHIPKLASPALLARLVLCAGLISFNWGAYIWAVQSGRATDASLGYYIFPLMAVALGYLVFNERFSKLQGMAILFAALAIVLLTVSHGAPPWVALFLAASFSVYGLIKKTIDLNPLLSVTVELVISMPFAIAYLVWLGAEAVAQTPGQWALLSMTVLFTGLPLVLISYASRRLDYATLGLLQYINPTMQAIVAVHVLSEPATDVLLLAFALIWIGVGLYGADLIRASRSRQ